MVASEAERLNGKMLAKVDDGVVEVTVTLGTFPSGTVIVDGFFVGGDGAEVYVV